jgi:hypothetical protein
MGYLFTNLCIPKMDQPDRKANQPGPVNLVGSVGHSSAAPAAAAHLVLGNSCRASAP